MRCENVPYLIEDLLLSQTYLRYAVLSSWFPEKILAGLPGDQSELFEFVVGALDFAFVDGEFLGECGGGGEGVAGGERFTADLVLDLFAHLEVDGIVRQVFQFNIHRLKGCASLSTANAGSQGPVLWLQRGVQRIVGPVRCRESAREIRQSLVT